MRAILTAVSLAFVLGTFAGPAAATCGGDHAAKKNDFETPVPAPNSSSKTEKQG